MDNRSFLSNASATPPTAPGSPSAGYPVDGNPSTGTAATIPGAYWAHQIGEELRAIIAGAGLSPNSSTLTQLRDALFTGKSIAADGYLKLGPLFGGLILQWGTVTGITSPGNTNGTNVTQSVTFPQNFPTSCVFLAGSGLDNANQEGSEMAIGWTARSTTGGTARITRVAGSNTGSETLSMQWFALGY